MATATPKIALQFASPAPSFETGQQGVLVIAFVQEFIGATAALLRLVGESPLEESWSLGDDHLRQAVKRLLIEHCRQHLIKWSCPRQVEFLRELPKTRVGKIDYKVLVQQHVAAHETRDKA